VVLHIIFSVSVCFAAMAIYIMWNNSCQCFIVTSCIKSLTLRTDGSINEVMERELINANEVAKILSRDGKPLCRESVSRLAKAKGWKRTQGDGAGRPYFYDRSEIEQYLAVRQWGRPKGKKDAE